MSPKSKRELKKEQQLKEENIQKLEERMKQDKKIPKEYRKKIRKQLLFNLLTMLAFVIFLGCINIMSLYMETAIYLKVLRGVSIIVAVIAILYFECGYRKDNEKIFLYGVEVFVLALITLSSVYLYYIFFQEYNQLLLYITCGVVLYYIIKMVIIRRKMKKQYYKEQNDIKEIVKKG